MVRVSLVSLFGTALLTACGGGGGYAGVSPFPTPTPRPPAPAPPAPAPPAPAPGQASAAQGFYNGTTSNSFGFSAVVLETGEFWGIYASGGVIQGAVHGQSTAVGSSFTGSGADYHLPTGTRTATTFAGTFAAKGSISGTIASNGANFSGSYDASYEVPAQAADIAGTWTGQAASQAGVQAYSVTIDGAGNLQGSVSTCTFSGTARPRPSGKAVFNTTVTFAASGCLFNGRTLTGISVLSGAVGSRALLTAALLPDGSNGFLAAGAR
jgi:hypothetical protein